MDPGIDDPDERRFQQFAEKTSRNVNDASEVVRALDERIGAIKADCQETERKLRDLDEGDERSWLIYRLQRQRLLYARYHVRKVAILKKLADYGTLTLPGDEMESIAREARDLRQMTTEDVRLMEDHLRRHSTDAGHGHSTSFHQHSHGNHEAKRETWRAYFNALFDRLHGSHHEEEHETTTRRNCDTIEAARRFYAEQFARGFEPISDDHEDESWVTSRETILFGGNETSNYAAVGASANATIERRDHYRDQRHVTDEEIRYVHEHVRSYRLEATLQRDQWSEISAELQRLYEKDPDLFRKHFGDEQPWRHDSDDDQHDHRGDDFETIKIVDTQSTTATSRDDTASISVSLTSRDESAIFEEDEEADDATTRISSNGTTPTPTVEVVQGRNEHGHLLLRSDDFELAPFVVEATTHVHEGGRTNYTVEEEQEIEHTRRRLPQPEAPTQVLIYEGFMAEKPLIIVLDRYPYEWYYEMLSTPRVQSTDETEVLTEISETVKTKKMIEPLGQPEPQVRTEVLWRRSELPYMKMDERRQVSEFGELIFTHEIEETTEHSPKIRRKPVESDDRPSSQKVDLPIGQGVSKYEVLSYREFSEHPLVVSIDTYPHEWYYELLPQPVVVYDEFGRAVHETTTRFDIEEEVTTERSPKIRRRRPDDILRGELSTLHYSEFVPHPLIISLDRYPREWWYEHVHHEHPIHQQPLELQPLSEQRQHILEEEVSHIGYEIKETFEQSPAIRHIKELEELIRSPTVELPYFEERLVFHLLNYDQDMPHLPFHIRRRPVAPVQEPVVEPIRIERVIEEVKTLLLRESEMLQSPLLVQQVLQPLEPVVVIDERSRQQEEVGRLMLRDTEFGRYPLDSYLSQRPTTFEWIPMPEQTTRVEEFPLGQPEPTFTGHVVYRERPLSHTPETALYLLEPTHDLTYSIYEPIVEIKHLPQHMETGRLLLRDEEFGPWPLNDFIHQRPDYFEYDLHYHVHSPSEYKYEEIPLGQHFETSVGTLEYVEHAQSVWIVEKTLENLPQPAPRLSTHKHEHHSEHHDSHFHLPDVHLPHFHLSHHEHKHKEHEKPEHEHEHLHKHPEHKTHHHEHPEHSKHAREHHEPHFHLPHVRLGHHKHHKPSTEEPEHVIYDLPPSEVYEMHYGAEMPFTGFEVEKQTHYEMPPPATVYDEPPVFTDFPTWGQSHQYDYELIYRPDFNKHPLVIEECKSHVYELPVEQPVRARSETKKSEDFLLLRGDDLDNLPYTHARPPSLSYTNIGDTRRSRTSTVVSELSDVQLLWRRTEFRASLYEPNRRVVVEREVRRETDPIVRRQPSASTAASDIQELRRSTSEVGRSMSSISSDTISSVYDQHLFLRLEMPFSPLVINRVPSPLTFEPEKRERGVPPRRPLEPIPSLPTPVVSPVEKTEFLHREEMEPSERIHAHQLDFHLSHHKHEKPPHVQLPKTPPPQRTEQPLERLPREHVYWEPIADYENELLHKDHEFHSHPLDYAIYEMPPYVAKAEEEFERVMAEPHVHPHMEPISSDLRLTLPSEHLEPLINDEDLYNRPLELPRRKTDEDIEVLFHRTAEMDELLFDEVWHLLDSTRPHRRRLSEIQEETMSFGPESNANSKSSSDRGPIGTTAYHELPQLKFEQYGNTAPIYDVPFVESPSSQALSPDYPHHQHQLCYVYDLPQIPLQFESTDLPPIERPPPIPEELVGHSDFSSSSSESGVEHVEADREYEVTEFRSHQSIEPIYAEIGPTHVYEQPAQLPKTPPPQRTKQTLVKRMAEAYSRQHEHRDVPVVPIPRLHRIWPHEELSYVSFQATSVASSHVMEAQKPIHQQQHTHHVHRHPRRDTIEFETASNYERSPVPVRATERFRHGHIDEIVRIGGEDFRIVEKLEIDGRTYSIERHADLRRLFTEYHIEDAWLDRYVRSQRWQIPMFLVPGAHKRLELPIRPTSRRRISLGLMLRRTQLSASAPEGLDHLHMNDVFQQIEPIGQPAPSETSWSVRSPTRSRSSPFVHRYSHAEVEETNELFQNPAFIRARQHADAFAWGSIHRKQGREIASVLHRADSKTAESVSFSAESKHDNKPHHHFHDEKPHHHVYDTVYEEPHQHHRDSVDHYAEPIPVAARRLTQTTAPSLPSTPPPKMPPAFSLKSEERPLSIAERLLTKTSSFEHRHRHPSGTAETPSEHSEQRLTPFGSRRSFTSERRKWLGDEEETEVGSVHDEAEEIHRAVHGLRHVEPPKAATERTAVHSDEERENRDEFARVQLRHVESGSLRRKRRLEHRESDPYIRHPTEPDFVPGLHFPKRRFLTYLLRAPPIRGRARYYNKMPELTDGLQFMNGVVVADELLDAVDNEQTAHIDPTSLLQKMYTVDYNPLVETRTRFRSMEGHMEVPNDEAVVEPIEKPWKSLYFRIRDGRFQWFASHGADEHPMGDVLLVDTKITASTSDWTFKVEGGKENANLYVRAPSNVFEKWRIALLSNSASQLIDAYVHPVRPVVPHYTQKVMFIEIGRCNIRAGIHTNKPSLPQSFFPAIASIADVSGQLTVGIDALKPEVRRRGRLHRPLEDGDGSSTERVRLNSQVVEACVRKAIDDIKLQPETFKVLLSVAQDVPAIHVAPLLRILLETIGFQAATIARQPSLILFSYDVTTGVVVDLGERLHIVPVIDEYIVDSAVISLPFGAAQIRSAVRKRLEGGEAAKLIDNPSAVAHVALREAVRQSCFVSADASNESAKTATVELGDLYGKKITVDEIRYEATEGFFDPQRWGLELKGLHRLIHDVIQQSPIDSRRTLYRNIYLAGGTSLLPGLAERLETELGKVAPASIFVQVHGSPWRYHAGYLGAQVLANSHSFNQCFAEKTNLDEYIKQIETEVS
ncbi:hypothetical protein M3Y98_00814600 [Aphelenchoides besseyi]|nr:hypothetical protein M3Y98_00814600 [Aphelenchoides besseyi]